MSLTYFSICAWVHVLVESSFVYKPNEHVCDNTLLTILHWTSLFRLRFRVGATRGHPKTRKQRHKTCAQARYRSPRTTWQNAQKNMCIHEVVTGDFGWVWWVFMDADMCSGNHLRIGARKGGREGHEWSSWAETASRWPRKISKIWGLDQRG